MKYCDLTLAYSPTSGGIRTYIDAKRKYIREHTDDEHVLIIPGETTEFHQDGRLSTYKIASPIIPGCAPYRFFWRAKPLYEALLEASPDVVELGSFFVCPYAAFRYRKRRQQIGKPCLVSAYFHTDVANAYFGAPLEHLLAHEMGDLNETLSEIGHNIADSIERGAKHHFGHIFEQCDLLMAASGPQRDRMIEYGVEDAELVPLGVDTELFNPSRRSNKLRRELGADENTILLVYAGRLDSEKHPNLLIEALNKLSIPNVKLVLSGEGTLRPSFEILAERNPNLVVIPYIQDREAFATLLASSDIYVTAGPHETFGLSIVEAQAAGLPVVGVSAGALPERVVDGIGYLGPVDDPPSFALNIEKTANNLKTMKLASRKHIEDQKLGWIGTCKALFKLYESEVSPPKHNCSL